MYGFLQQASVRPTPASVIIVSSATGSPHAGPGFNELFWQAIRLVKVLWLLTVDQQYLLAHLMIGPWISMVIQWQGFWFGGFLALPSEARCSAIEIKWSNAVPTAWIGTYKKMVAQKYFKDLVNLEIGLIPEILQLMSQRFVFWI